MKTFKGAIFCWRGIPMMGLLLLAPVGCTTHRERERESAHWRHQEEADLLVRQDPAYLTQNPNPWERDRREEEDQWFDDLRRR